MCIELLQILEHDQIIFLLNSRPNVVCFIAPRRNVNNAGLLRQISGDLNEQESEQAALLSEVISGASLRIIWVLIYVFKAKCVREH